MLALIALPIVGNWLGGEVAEVLPVSRRTLSLALHVAVGIVLAVVGLEQMPEALEASPAWVPILAFMLGALFFVGLDAGVDRLQGAMNGTKSGADAKGRASAARTTPRRVAP